LKGSTPNVLKLVQAVMVESVGLGMDTIMFDATAATAIRPAGLRAGVTVTTASAATTPAEAMQADLARSSTSPRLPKP